MRSLNNYSYEYFAVQNIQDYWLNEELHVFRNCVDAIDDLAEEIYAAADIHCMLSGPTEWAYNPELKRAVNKSNEPELYDNSFPIFIQYETNMGSNEYMAIADRKIYPDKIVLGINVTLIENLNIYQIREKLKHEFGHIRQNYGQRDYDISQNKKFVGTDYDKTIFRLPDGYEMTVYDVIDGFMYIFSPAEMQQRYNELYQHLTDLTTNELEQIAKRYKNRNQAVAYAVELTENIHLLRVMKEYLEQVNDAIRDEDDCIPLLLAYYFKTYNIWQTSDYISVDLVQKCIDEKTTIENTHRIVLKFRRWLRDIVIRKYLRYVHSIVHYVLYTRLWTFDDTVYFRKDSKIQDFVNQLRTDVESVVDEVKE